LADGSNPSSLTIWETEEGLGAARATPPFSASAEKAKFRSAERNFSKFDKKKKRKKPEN